MSSSPVKFSKRHCSFICTVICTVIRTVIRMDTLLVHINCLPVPSSVESTIADRLAMNRPRFLPCCFLHLRIESRSLHAIAYLGTNENGGLRPLRENPLIYQYPLRFLYPSSARIFSLDSMANDTMMTSPSGFAKQL